MQEVPGPLEERARHGGLPLRHERTVFAHQDVPSEDRRFRGLPEPTWEGIQITRVPHIVQDGHPPGGAHPTVQGFQSGFEHSVNVARRLAIPYYSPVTS